MPISTDLSVDPYYDDYNPKDNYSKILFKPGVAVQVRELNQLQTILQNQIERFGDNIYKRGTIIDGCSFTFHNLLSYAKINDLQVDGAPVNINSFKGQFVRNLNNLAAQVIETADGYETSDPNLKTLFLKYVNTGDSGNTPQFSSGEVLTVYDPAFSLWEADVIVPSSGFSNTDKLVFLSSIEVLNQDGELLFTNSSGQACNFSVGEIITQSITNARAIIKEVNTSANSESLILKIKPLASDLRIGNTSSWLFAPGYNIVTSCTAITANLVNIIGSGAVGEIATDSVGGVITVAITNGGTGYYVEPTLSVSYSTPNTSSAANSFVDALSISVKNYKAQVRVNGSPSAIGFGVGLGVSEGIVYQKGYFSRVPEQFTIVDKYNSFTNNIVGFDTSEEIIDFREDTNLVDNASGTYNVNAPGADRLKLVPKLKVIPFDPSQSVENLAIDEENFLPIIEYSLGRPYKKRLGTQFNSIEKEMAQRTFEQSGNYVLDQFLLNTNCLDSLEQDTKAFRLSVDPGTAYIDGYRVQTFAAFNLDSEKGLDTSVKSTEIPINYGNYIIVDQLAGTFDFPKGATISLRNTAANYIQNSCANTVFANQFPSISAAGTEIGTARIRSMTLVSGIAGTGNARYYLYLFDIRMNRGRNFKNVRSVFYDAGGVGNGVADIVLDGGLAVIYESKFSSLVLPSGGNALKNANNIEYTYRTVKTNLTCNTAGQIRVSIAENQNEYFGYAPELSDLEKQTIIVTPLENSQASANAAGAVATSAGNGIVTGTSTTFDTTFEVGDYVRIYTPTASEVKRIIKIANATSMTVVGNVTNTFSSANISLYFPRFTPIPLNLRDNRDVNVISNTSLVIKLGNTIPSQINVAVAFNAKRRQDSTSKTITRNAFVKIYTGNNITTSTGPWCLGLPDIVRLKEVYLGRTVTFDGFADISEETDFISIPNNPYLDGDVINYRTNDELGEGETTSVINLIPNANYFVVSSNTSGIKVSETSGGTPVELSKDVEFESATHKFVSVNTRDPKITDNFWIDHNQKKDYYDVGFLYKTANYRVPNETMIMVEFDVLYTNEEGLKTISSYPIRDDLPLANNTFAMNTLEIPEMYHDTGEYFDLRDCLDFRPYSANTTAIITDDKLAIINPIEPTTNQRFNQSLDKKFPAPQSSCKITLEQYLGRVDAVTISGNSFIRTIEGTPSEKPQGPLIPKDELLINYLIVPPYPSVPQKRSDQLNEILNKRIANIQLTNKRERDYKITTPITPVGLKQNQPRRYTMQDIGSLERRISDLEYYTALSFTEDTINNLQIPSSIDGETNRFKFGFFVDNFTTANFAEINDPNYNAQIFGYELGAPKKQYNIKYKFNMLDPETASCVRGKKVLVPSKVVTIVSQAQATEATELDVAITETKYTTTGERIDTVTTTTKRVTVEDWELLTKQFNAQIQQKYMAKEGIFETQKVLKTVIRVTIAGEWSTSAKQFQASHRAGYVRFVGWRRQSYTAEPRIYRQLRNGTWIDSGVIPNYSGKTLQTTIYHGAAGPNPTDYNNVFKVTEPDTRTGYQNAFVSEQTTETQEYVDEQVKIGEKDVEKTRWVPQTLTIYKVDKTTNVTTTTTVIPTSTVVESTTSVTNNLFKPNQFGLMDTDDLFNYPDQINSPTVDLLQFIYSDINS